MIVELSPTQQAHLAVALRRHLRRLHRDGLTPPAHLADLADLLLSGQERPKLAVPCAGPEAEPLIGVSGAAGLLGISPRSLRRLAASGAIPQVRIGRRHVAYRQDDLAAYIDSACTTRRATG